MGQFWDELKKSAEEERRLKKGMKRCYEKYTFYKEIDKCIKELGGDEKIREKVQRESIGENIIKISVGIIGLILLFSFILALIVLFLFLIVFG